MKTGLVSRRKQGIGLAAWLIAAGFGALVAAVVLMVVVQYVLRPAGERFISWLAWTDHNPGPPLPPFEPDFELDSADDDEGS